MWPCRCYRACLRVILRNQPERGVSAIFGFRACSRSIFATFFASLLKVVFLTYAHCPACVLPHCFVLKSDQVQHVLGRSPQRQKSDHSSREMPSLCPRSESVFCWTKITLLVFPDLKILIAVSWYNLI